MSPTLNTTTPCAPPNSTTAAANSPRPAQAGTLQSFLLGGLTANRAYYLAVRAVDKGGNASPLVAVSVW